MSSTIRTATDADRPAIKKLLASLGIASAPARDPGRHFVLVVDGTDGLAGCAELVIAGPRAHLVMLAIDPRTDYADIEERLLGVAEAMSEAFGARGLDVPPARAA